MKGNFCPLLKKDCVEHKCAWYINVMGVNPQTGQETNDWGCSISYIPLLQMETAKQSRSTTSSVDQLRSEQDIQTRAQCHVITTMLASQQVEPTVTKLISE